MEIENSLSLHNAACRGHVINIAIAQCHKKYTFLIQVSGLIANNRTTTTIIGQRLVEMNVLDLLDIEATAVDDEHSSTDNEGVGASSISLKKHYINFNYI